jgi:hypothetical protein
MSKEKAMYIVQVNDAPPIYRAGYFPRRFKSKAEAVRCAKAAIVAGATMARVECPNGGELDFRPSIKK